MVDDSTDAGVGQAQAVRETLGPITDSACNISVKKGDKDFSAAVTQIMGQKPDAVVYASYYSEAALLVQQLHDAGWLHGIFAGPTASRTRSSSRQQALPRRAPSCRARAGATGSFAEEYNKKFGQGTGHLQP